MMGDHKVDLFQLLLEAQVNYFLPMKRLIAVGLCGGDQSLMSSIG